MLGGSHTASARLPRRGGAAVARELAGEGLTERPLYFVSSNSHSLVNIVTGIAHDLEPELIAFVEQLGEDDILRQELAAFRAGESQGSWENFLYFVARLYFSARGPGAAAERRAAEQHKGVTHLRSTNALQVPRAGDLAGKRLTPGRSTRGSGQVDHDALAASGAVIVNIDYPLGVAAYNILREVAVDRTGLRGVYILGKAAALNADVGDIDDLERRPRRALGLDVLARQRVPRRRPRPGPAIWDRARQPARAVTVKSTFLQNRSYLDFYYREAFTVVEMETGPYCNAVYEIADADRHPVGEAVNFSKLPIDLGIIHYASDTPYTQARTLGARGLSYYGMDSTYASSLAILRRVLRLEGVLDDGSAKLDGLAGRLGPADPLLDPVAGDLPRGGVDAVPGVDAGDRDHQPGQLLLVVMAGSVVPDLVGHRIETVGEPRGRLGQRQGRPLGVGEVRSLPPRADHVDALVGLARGLELARVHIQAHAAAVDRARAHLDQVPAVLAGTPAFRAAAPSC